MTAIQNTDDYLRGQADCRDGKPHKSGHSKDYDRGYNRQYEWEQILDDMHRRNKRWT